LSPEIARFFFAAEMLILEGYGLTETAAASTGNRVERFRFGSVGIPGVGVGEKIADDGEVLIRGRHIMKGYWNRPDATAEAFAGDGWFRSGDLGAIDADGFLQITGRKKDILVTAGGKNIAPQKIENKIKAACPYVQEVVMLGDRRKFCVALVSLDEESARKWADDHGRSDASYAQLCALPELKELVWGYVADVNSTLASYETIKAISVLDHELSIESGELTPSMKVKRRIVEERNRALLDSFYTDQVAAIG